MKTCHFKNVTLEISGKAFTDESEEKMYSVCRTMFKQWSPLTRWADRISILLWIADGSEILEYTGVFSQKFEWGYWVGCANPFPQPEKITPGIRRNGGYFPKKYLPDAAPRPYSWLKRLIEVIRETGKEITGKPIRIGATFDNGPEFAVSNFKYKKHREIAEASSAYPNSFVTCTSTLHADPQPYAGFPGGIPEGTPIGEFLGKQFRRYAHDLGYDYIWLSNGMGFGTETWGVTGFLFDKKRFYPEKADEAARKMLSFWEAFTAACPDVVIETRGSNFSAGIEMASDAAPLREVYSQYGIVPPVNPPFAALEFTPGLELGAWMSHIADIPGDASFPFRFYTHDPWFMNSPWLDRYERSPWDIFLPLGVSRIDAAGKVRIPDSVAFLSVDNTRGELPDQVPEEVIPILKDAFNTAPDAPGPLVWLYPFEEYDDFVRGRERKPEIVFNEDFFLGEMIQSGLPLNTVICAKNFRNVVNNNLEALRGSIMVVPASYVTAQSLPLLKKLIDRKCKILFYGTVNKAAEELTGILGIKPAAALTGKVKIKCDLEADHFENGCFADSAEILPQFDGGGLTEVIENRQGITVCAEAVQGEEKRVIAMIRKLDNGAEIAFLRSVMPCDPDFLPEQKYFSSLPPDKTFPVANLMRYMLAEFGWLIKCSAFSPASSFPRTTISRNENAFYFSVYAKDTSVDMSVNTPLGAPILTTYAARLKDGCAVWRPDRTWHKECRCFVKQKEDGVISGILTRPGGLGYTTRRHYKGLKNAEVRFFVPCGFEDRIEINHDEFVEPSITSANLIQPEWEDTPYGRCIHLKNITGYLHFAW